jgi:HK97 family phage prohead protease
VLKLESGFEIKEFDSGSGEFYGYGSVFGNVDGHLDVVDSGAFDDAISNAKNYNIWPDMLLQHGMGNGAVEDQMPIGIWTDMSADHNGLMMQGKLALDNSRGAAVYSLMKMQPRPALNGLSIGYVPTRWTNHAKGSKANGARRTLHSVKLFETSLVTSPSNKLARVYRVKSIREVEKDYREQGHSLSAAKRMARESKDAEFVDSLMRLRDTILSCR